MKPFLVLLLVLAGLAALFFSIQALSSHGDTNIATSTGKGDTAQKPATSTPIESPTNVQSSRSTPPTTSSTASATDTGVEAADRSNVLTGLVVNDQGKPVAGANVSLSKNAMMGEAIANDWFMGRDKPTGKPLTTVTDAAGLYHFKNVEAARDYYVFVQHKDYSPSQEQNVVVNEEGESHAPDAVLRPGSVLTGFVYDENSNGIAGAQVALDSAYVLGNDPKSPDRSTATTDNTGYFEFKNVAAGPRSLTASVQGFGLETKSNLMFKGSPDDRQQLDFKLKPGHPIAGRVVVQGTNQGLKGAQVTAMTFGNTSSSRGETVSNEDGTFQIDGLQQGAYMVQVEFDCYRQTRMNRVQVDDMNVLVEMMPRARVTGRVVDGANNPVKTFKATAMHTVEGAGAAGQFENSGVSVQVDNQADGSFQICNFDPGAYVIMIEAPGMATAISDKFTIADNQAPVSITVRTSLGGSIKGRVVDPSGNPIKGALIASRDNSIEDDMDPMFGNLIGTTATARKTRSDRDGNFELKMLAAADYRLMITHPNYTHGVVSGLRVVEGQTTDSGAVTLRGGGVLSGKVLDQAGKPVGRGFVHVVSVDNATVGFDARTDTEGRYSIAHLPAGNYEVSAMRAAPGSGADPFQSISEQQASHAQVNVIEGQESTRDLNIGGG